MFRGLYIIASKDMLTASMDSISFLLALLFMTGLAVLTISITTMAEITDSNIQAVWKSFSSALKIIIMTKNVT